VDASAPPAYIDPRCFVSADGFMVVDNALSVFSLRQTPTPTPLWNSVAGVILLKGGTFYNSLTGQLNYLLGYTATPFGTLGTTPTGVNYIFYLTAWSPAGTVYNDTLTLTLFDATAITEQASITLDCLYSGATGATSGNGGVVSITAVSGGGSYGSISTYTATGGTGYTAGQVVNIVQVQAGGGGLGAQNATIQIDTVGGPGNILTSHLLNGGSGYYDGPAYPNNIESASTKLVINGPTGGPVTYTISSTSVQYDRQSIVAAMVAAINAGPDLNVTAASSIDGYSIILTAIAAGVGGNSITVQDTSSSSASTVAPTFYFSCRVTRNLEGGQISESSNAPRSFAPPCSAAEVGGTVYFANLGPMILKYSGPGLFTTSTMYNGVGVIRKFAGSMIGLRLQNQLGVFTQNQDMIFAWTSGENLDEWAPETVAGLVTGAGFEQLADIGDYLTGLIVSNGTAFIIRAQGVSYATATGNSTLPYSVNHVGLGDQGEGGQIAALVCQYDQSGVYVGNSDIYQVSGTIASIGAKIKSLIFAALQSFPNPGNAYDSVAVDIFTGGDTQPIVALSIGPTPFAVLSSGIISSNAIFLYNTNNGTWMAITLPHQISNDPATYITTTLVEALTSILTFAGSQQYNQTQLAVITQESVNNVLSAPVISLLTEGVPNSDSLNNKPFITFPQEEVAFGRDVTVDGLYVSLWGDVVDNVTLNFYVTLLQNITTTPGAPAVYESVQILFATLVLTSAQFNTLEGNPIELQLFPTYQGAGAITGHSPQLSIQVNRETSTNSNLFRIAKLGMYCTVDANQRPV
jgi:hypothetical protein